MPQVYLLKIWHNPGSAPWFELRHQHQGSLYFSDLEALKAHLGKQTSPTKDLVGNATPAAQQGETP